MTAWSEKKACKGSLRQSPCYEQVNDKLDFETYAAKPERTRMLNCFCIYCLRQGRASSTSKSKMISKDAKVQGNYSKNDDKSVL